MIGNPYPQFQNVQEWNDFVNEVRNVLARTERTLEDVKRRVLAGEGEYDFPSATDKEAGVLKLYGTTGNNEDGTITQKGITQAINDARYTLPSATATQLGGVKIGDRLSVDENGLLSADSIPTASVSIVGGAKIGSGLHMDKDTLHADSLPIASESVLGGIKIGEGLNIDENGVVSSDSGGAANNYGVCSTAADVAAKEVSVTGFKLETGASVKVKFANTNTAANPTLNVGGTGAKAIYVGSSPATTLLAEQVYGFVYDGDRYILEGGTISKSTPNLYPSQSDVKIYRVLDNITVTVNNDGNGVIDAFSDNTSVATVSVSGNIITVTSVAIGTATVMVYSTETTTYSSGIARISVTCEEAQEVGICLVQTDGGSGTWDWVDENGNTLNGIDFNNTYPWRDIEKVTIDGQIMIKIPKFYVKYGTIPAGRDNARKKARWVSDKKPSDYHIHPAFVKNGKVMDCFYIGAYEAYNAGSNKAGSAASQTPWVNIGGFANAKTYCTNRGEGWHLQNIYEIAAINILMMIELETPNVQTAIAAGNVSSSAAQATGATAAVWREIHEWWGNVWEHVDGLTTDANGIYRIFSNKMDGSYVSTGVTNPASGWIAEMSEAKGTNFDLTDVFLPSATSTGGGNGTYGDFHWTGKDSVLLRSGGWDNGQVYGAFAFSVTDGASVSSIGIGLRLAKEGTVTDEVA